MTDTPGHPVAALAHRLPDPRTLRDWSQSLAMLDAILSPEWQYRYFSFDSAWAEAQQLASMRNGSGDEYSITFAPAGTFVRGFDHESDLSPFGTSPPRVRPGLLDRVPPALAELAAEPAFTMSGVPAVTLCLWRLVSEPRWSYGIADQAMTDDGGSSLFDQLDGTADAYLSFAAEYYEVEADEASVRRIIDHEPLRAADVQALNADLSLADLHDDLVQIDYPLA